MMLTRGKWWRLLMLVFMATMSWRAAADPAPLQLEKTIPLPGVGGRIDHMTVDLKRQRLVVAALGNDTVEIIDLAAGRPLPDLRGLAEPQGVAYVDLADVIFAANAGDGP